MRELRASAIWALATSVPTTAICWYFTWALIHSSDTLQHVAGTLLAPALGVIYAWIHLGFGDNLLLVPACFVGQFLGYLLVIHLIRLSLRRVRGAGA